MPHAIRTLVMTAALPLIGCSAHRAAPAEPPAGLDVAVAGYSCAPNDGPAVEFYLSNEPLTAVPVAPPLVRVQVNTGLDALVGHTVRWDAPSDLGFAQRCDATGDCVAASAARVHVARRDAGGALVGDLTLVFNGAATVAGSFVATWRDSHPMCG